MLDHVTERILQTFVTFHIAQVRFDSRAIGLSLQGLIPNHLMHSYLKWSEKDEKVRRISSIRKKKCILSS